MSATADSRESAQSLRRRLNDHAVDIELLAAEAAAVFDAAGSATHVRWLELERKGYGSLGSSSSLPDALGVGPNDRLVVHVFAYRSQSGQAIDDPLRPQRPFRHFFVEPLADLVAAAKRMKATSVDELRLDFGSPVVLDYPVSGIFPNDVFDRILLGFRATLHLQLGAIA